MIATSTLILLGLGVLTAFIGGILMLVAAFRQSIVWGLVTLFVPFGNLVFLVVHWAKARTGFLTSLAGTLLCVGGLFANPEARNMLAEAASQRAGGFPGMGEPPPPTVQDLSAQIAEKRGELESLQAAFHRQGLQLPAQYQALERRRQKLQAADQDAIAQFNVEAAAYQAQNQQHKGIAHQITTVQAALDQLLDDRSRAAKGPAGKKIVMYTTARCPACVTAKRYMVEKGIAYQEIDVERSPEGMAAFQKLGGRGVPLILVGDKKMVGFNPQELERLRL